MEGQEILKSLLPIFIFWIDCVGANIEHNFVKNAAMLMNQNTCFSLRFYKQVVRWICMNG